MSILRNRARRSKAEACPDRQSPPKGVPTGTPSEATRENPTHTPYCPSRSTAQKSPTHQLFQKFKQFLKSFSAKNSEKLHLLTPHRCYNSEPREKQSSYIPRPFYRVVIPGTEALINK